VVPSSQSRSVSPGRAEIVTASNADSGFGHPLAALATRPPIGEDQNGGGVRMDSTKLALSVPEVAQLLGISRAFAYELVARRELPALRLGRRLVVPRHLIEALLNQGGHQE